MSRRYTDQQKTETLQHLDDNYGNVTLTSLQTGVPTRTLRDWKRRRKLEAAQALPPKKVDRRRQQTAASDAEEPHDQYTRIRARLMQHIDTLLETLTDDPDTAHLRIVALSRLLDRVIKLESLTKSETESVIRFEYKYPDGTIHDVPPWYEPDDTTDPIDDYDQNKSTWPVDP